jgi:predicted transcriptional regulator
MTDLLERAVEKLRSLPPDRQNEIAELLFVLAAQEPGAYEFSDEQLAKIKKGLAEADAGDFLSNDEVTALFLRSRL